MKARVADLESIPQFIVFSESEGFEGDSQTIQCEILQQEMLGAGPPDEDPIPVQNQVEGQLPFDFFGLGQQQQQGQGQFQNQMQGPIVQQAPVQNQQPTDQMDGWADWPEELPALGQQVEQIQVINSGLNLNEQPLAVLQDLNADPVLEDLEEMLIHPPQQFQNANWEQLVEEVQHVQQVLPEPEPQLPIE